MEHIILPIIVAFLFYLVIPGIGAFSTRAKWRWFRRSIIQISLRPDVSYAAMRRPDGEIPGNYRIIGNLQAIEGGNVVWVKSGSVSVAAELSGVDVYVLPVPDRPGKEGGIEHYDVTMSELIPRQVPWNSIFSLPEGTELLISGTLHVEGGRGIFRSSDDNPLLVVIFEGKPDTIIPRSIWIGRQKNEYWNRFTPISVTAGSFALFIIAYTLFKIPLLRLEAIVTVTMSLFPVIPFLPPGVMLFFLYRFLWKRARILRAERDLFRLPLRYFDTESDPTVPKPLPNGECYGMKTFDSCTGALKSCGGGSIRTSILLPEDRIHRGGCCAFGAVEDGKITAPADPLSELVFIPGNPEDLAELCSRRARRFEILSGLSFIGGCLINGILLLVLISTFLG